MTRLNTKTKEEKMRKIKIAAFVIAAVFAGATMTYAQQMKDMKGMHGMNMSQHAKMTTIKGEVVDLACYLTKGEHGAKHEECAQMCINSGLPVGILDKDGHVYLAITANHKPANSLLVQYAAKEVEVTGTVDKRGGMDVVAVDKIEPLNSK